MFKEIDCEEYNRLELEKHYNIGNNPYSKCFIYVENECYMGFIVYSLIYERMEIEYIYVENEYRRKKIGTKLINRVEKIGIENKCENVSLEVCVENVKAINLYEKCGFVEVATRENYYNGKDGILMLKKLGD